MNLWKKYRLYDLINLIGGGTPRTGNPEFWGGEIGWLSVVDFNGLKYVSKTEKTITQRGLESSSTKLLEKGDIIISARGTVGAVAILADRMAFNQSCFGISPIKSIVENEFIYYLIKNEIKALIANSQGQVFDSITRETFRDIVVEIPSKPEQIIISKILGIIDQAIEKTEQLIAKYERIKTGLMQDLLSRGIDEEGNIRTEETHEFKDSELGRIPKEWEIGRIENYLSRIIDYRGKTPKKVDEGIPLITAKIVRLGFLENPNEFIQADNYESWMTRGIPNVGDVLFTTEAPLGNIAQTPEGKIALGQRIITLQTTEGLKSDYLFYLLLFPTIRQQFLKLASGSTVTGIKQSQFRRIKLFIPKANEQEKVIQILQHMDKKGADEKHQLQKLRFLKTALMQDLLTGKVSVASLIEKQ